jgi:hypothetical protein
VPPCKSDAGLLLRHDRFEAGLRAVAAVAAGEGPPLMPSFFTAAATASESGVFAVSRPGE